MVHTLTQDNGYLAPTYHSTGTEVAAFINLLFVGIMVLCVVVFVFQFICYGSRSHHYFILNIPHKTLKQNLLEHLFSIAGQSITVELVGGMAVANFDHVLTDREWTDCEKFDGSQLILLHVLSNIKFKYRGNIRIKNDLVEQNFEEETLSVKKPVYQCLLLKLIEDQCGQRYSTQSKKTEVEVDTFHTEDERQPFLQRGTDEKKVKKMSHNTLSSSEAQSSQAQCSQHSPTKTDTLSLEEYLYLYFIQYHKEEFDQILHQNYQRNLVTYKYKSGNLEIRGEEHLVSNAAEGIVQLCQRVSPNLDSVTYNPPKGTDAEAFKLEARVKVATPMQTLMIPKDDGIFQLYGPKGKLRQVVQKLKNLANELNKPTTTLQPTFSKNEPEVSEYQQNPSVENRPERIKVHVLKGDLTKQETDVIVNPANVRLKHKGGAARAIANAAGSKLIAECDEYLKQNGPLKIAQAMHTNAGKLPPPIKYVIHIVGPNSNDYPTVKEQERILEETFFNCLKYANDTLSASSISIPAISSGIFGVPKDLVAQAAHAALRKYEFQRERSDRKQKLHRINFVNIDDEATDAFRAEFQGSRSCWASDNNILNESDRNQKKQMPRSKSADPKKQNRQLLKRDFSNPASNNNQRPLADGSVGRLDDGVPSEVMPKMQKLKAAGDNAPEVCVICMEPMMIPKSLECGHKFCEDCIKESFEKCQPKCPSCGRLFGVMKGNQPPGTMKVNTISKSLSGYEKYNTIVLEYRIPSGIQEENHPNPGHSYNGTTRAAFLPDNDEGREVCQLLQQAFDSGLIFTVGRSITTGYDNQVIWNDIHHKTSEIGPFGYPDPGYLSRVKEELKAKGIVSEAHKNVGFGSKSSTV